MNTMTSTVATYLSRHSAASSFIAQIMDEQWRIMKKNPEVVSGLVFTDEAVESRAYVVQEAVALRVVGNVTEWLQTESKVQHFNQIIPNGPSIYPLGEEGVDTLTSAIMHEALQAVNWAVVAARMVEVYLGWQAGELVDNYD
jgi:hypothetical protein